MPSQLAPESCAKCGAALSTDGLCFACMIEDGITPPGQAQPRQNQTEDSKADKAATTALPSSFGDYELIEEIARGGMGVVYEARQVSLNRMVAIKMILTGRLASAAELKRFQAEAEMAARLQHPNIVAIHEVGEFEGQPFFSMDYVEGKSLAQLAHNEPMPARHAAAYLKTIAEAVHYAHSRGVLHRDLKPSNILIDQSDQPRITDFGLAKRLEASALSLPHSPLTLTGQVLGSPNFMPPEQAAGDRKAVGPASDVYSLGAVLFQLLTGRPPFLAETLTQTLRLVAEAEPVAPRLLNPGVVRDLETICLKCLQKEPPRRYDTAQALAQDLGRFLRDEPISARPVTPLERGWRSCRRHPAVAGLSAVVLGLLLTVAIGSTLDASRLKQANERATENLRQAYLDQARAERLSGRAGRRFKGLELLSKAAEIRPSTEARNEPIACLALEDLRPIKEIKFEIGHWPAFDRTYERYALIDPAGNLLVRRLSDNHELARYPGPVLPIHGIALSPGGRYLSAYRGTETVRLFQVFDLTTQQSILSIGDVPVRNWEFSGDDSSLLVVQFTRPSGVFFYPLPSGAKRELFQSPTLPAGLRLDPSGGRLAISSDETTEIEVRDTVSGAMLYALTNPAPVAGVEWHPDGKRLLAYCADRRIYVWDTIKREKCLVLAGHDTMIHRALFSHDGDRIASSSADNTFRLWNAWNGQQILNRPAHGFAQHFGPGDRLIAVPAPRAVELCELIGRREWRAFHAVSSAEAGAWQCAWSSDGDHIVSAHRDGVRVWNVNNGHEIGLFGTDAGECHAVQFDGGSNLIAATSSGLRCWPVERNSSGTDTRLLLGQPVRFGPLKSADSLHIGRGGTLLAALVGGEIQLLEWPGRRVLQTLQSEKGINGCALSPGGRLCIAWGYAAGSALRVWDAITGAVLTDLQSDAVTGAVFTPDDRFLITGSSEEYVSWNTHSWAAAWRLPRVDSGGAHGRLALTQNGRLGALTLTAQAIRLFEPSTGRELATLEAPAPQILSWLAFSPDGNRLAASTQISVVHLGDLRLIRQELATMKLDW